MNCPKCGNYNDPQSKFCIKCGCILENLNNQNINQENLNNINQPNISEPYIEPIATNNSTSVGVSVSNVSLNYLMYFIAILLKPFKSFKEEESKLNNPKTAFILLIINTVIMTLVNIIQLIITTIQDSHYVSGKGYVKSINWSNLKYIEWFKTIALNILLYAGIILAIALVFYFGSLVIKKNLSFIKSLSISGTIVIPAYISGLILSPILSKIWSPLGMAISIIGLLYSFIMLYEFINSELNLNGDIKIYFNLICFGILLVAGYYIFMKIMMGSVSSGLEDILDLFS